MTLHEWLKNGKYLPSMLRDFHKQKNVFKLIDYHLSKRETVGWEKPTWLAAHIYVIDHFLWHMARFGYTLQRSRQRYDFFDLDNEIAEWRKEQLEHWKK